MKPIRRVDFFHPPKREICERTAQTMECCVVQRVLAVGVACAWILLEVESEIVTGNNVSWPAYNRCIGTVAESPEKGMRTDDTRSLEPTEM